MEKGQNTQDRGSMAALPLNRTRNDLPKAIDLSHHLSDLSKARLPSPLKTFFKYFGQPGLLILAGGVPHPDYFPFATLEASTLPSDAYPAHVPSATAGRSNGPLSWLWNLFGASEKQKLDHLTIPKYVDDPLRKVNLATSLQYSSAQGLPLLKEFMREYSTRFFDPAYIDYDVLMHTGNTDGWSRVIYSLCNPGDGIVVEEWTYPSAVYSSLPLGARTVGIPMDGEGMLPDKLEEVLANWDETARGFRRPHIMYTAPVGQNPSGLTTSAERKKAIYDICVRYDIIICEDDPYFILQEGDYVPKKNREAMAKAIGGQQQIGAASVNNDEEIEQFVSTLVPSYLKFDYQGRVVRLDTFSKTIAPGSRLGWFTCSPQLAERFERQGETSTQAPCGFGQALITQLLTKEWGLGAYTRWLRGVRTQYTIRRNALVDAFLEQFDVSTAPGTGIRGGAMVYECRLKQTGWRSSYKEKIRTVMSFVPASSGMFIWIKVHFDGLPAPKDGPNGEAMNHEVNFWEALAESKLLVLPGWLFYADMSTPTEDPNVAGHYRVSFSESTASNLRASYNVCHAEPEQQEEQMNKAVSIFATVTKAYFQQLAK